jgi:uncharacterized RDD family membrane protein YckC
MGRRVVAALIDLVVVVALLTVAALAFGHAHASGGSASVSVHGVGALVWFAATFAYYLVTEATLGGTLGKLLLGIRVTRVDGGAPSWGQIAGRTALRVVDILPALYLVGFIVALASGPRQQRVGDHAAGTVVVRV